MNIGGSVPNSPPTHSAAKQKKYNQRLEKSRPNSHQRGYDRKWAAYRKMYLAEHPLCVVCGGPANTVDHIIPHKGNRELFYDPENHQSMCKHDHDVKTAKERWGNNES